MKCTIGQLNEFLKTFDQRPTCKVATRFGYYPVNWIGITARNSRKMQIVAGKFSLIGSPDHRLLVNGSWVKIKNINSGDYVDTITGLQQIESVTILEDREDLYDLEVDTVHEFFANDIVSHNSTVSDAIKFALYGKVGARKLKDIPNRKNGHMEVEITVETPGKIVVIQRGLAPSFVNVTVNGNADTGDTAGKVNVQEYLEEEIFGMSFNVFSNILSLSINDFQSFLRMSPSSKRAIIDKIFGLSIINRMLDLLRQELRKTKEIAEQMQTKSQVLTSSINKSMEELESLNERLITNQQDTQGEHLANLEKIQKIKVKLNKQLDKLKQIEMDSKNEIRSIMSMVSKQTQVITHIEEKQKLYDLGQCPTCESTLDTEFHRGMKIALDENYLRAKDDLEALRSNLEALQATERARESEKDEIRSNLQKVEIKNGVITNELKKIEASGHVDEQTQAIRNIIEDTTARLQESQELGKKVAKKSNFLRVVEDILGDRGIKQMAIKTIIPTLNMHVSKLLKEMGLEFRITFNDEFDAIITHLGEEVSTATLSTGENKKADFAVLMAIIRLMKIKFPGINLLFLDEIFASLDMNSVHHILKILREISSELGLHTIVINHAAMDTTLFDKIAVVSKQGGFSNIELTEVS